MGCRLQTPGFAETTRAAKWNCCVKPLQLCKQKITTEYVSYSEDKCLATLLRLQTFLYTRYSVIRFYRFDYVREEGFFSLLLE